MGQQALSDGGTAIFRGAPKGMNPNIQVTAFKEENGHVLRFQAGDAIPHIHAHPAHQIIAVGLTINWRLGPAHLAEEAFQGRLGAGMEMHLRLLQEELSWTGSLQSSQALPCFPG